MANNFGTDNSDDTISLEGLLDDSASPPGSSVETIDNILEVEDPEFTAELRELSKIKPDSAEVDADLDVDTIVARERAEIGSRGPKKLIIFLFVRPVRRVKQFILSGKTILTWLKASGLPMLKTGAVHSLQALKTGAGAGFGKIKSVLGAFGALPFTSKLLVLAVPILGALATVMTLIAYRGDYLPTLEKNFLVSFTDVASQKFEVPKDAPWVDINDPMLHPEHIVLIERIIANLRAPGDGSNPMALIDLYLEAGSQESAIELKNRDAEARDVIGRTLEQMTYEDLSTDAGKTKLKVFVRKSLNEFLSRGRIRRVFFKSIVLKP